MGDGNPVALQVAFIKRQTMRFQDNSEFLKKRNAAMMFFLPLDILAYLRHLRFTHRERPISLLPRESRGLRECLRNPAGRVSLDLADELRDRLVLPQFRQDMNMVRSSVDDQRDSFFIADGAAQVLMNARADWGCQPWFAALCRKNDVIEQVAIGGTHNGANLRRPSSGAALFLYHTPGVPLRSTPGFNPAHPPGAVAEIRISAHEQRVSAPKARWITARSAAKRNSGNRFHNGLKPLARGGGERVPIKRRIPAEELKK